MSLLKLSKSQQLRSIADRLMPITSQDKEGTLSIKIENCVGFSKVPVGLAGPLLVTGEEVSGSFHAPLATYEPTLIASCSRGCKVFNNSGGIHFDVLGEGMSRAPVFAFDDPSYAVTFCRAIPSIQDEFAKWAESTSSHVRLQGLRPTVIGSQAHLFCSYHCGSAVGQNMVTKATQHACDMLQRSYATRFKIRDFFIEGQLASDKKPSWGNVQVARGVQVLSWGIITPAACQKILGCSTERLYLAQQTLKEGGIRNGQFGSNINTANIIAAMFISTGQDPGSTAEASWCHLTSEFDQSTGNLCVSLYFPSLPVGTVGGGTGYPTQKEALTLLECDAPGMKNRLAGMIAAFALALDISTSASIANDTFTQSHMRLARGETVAKL